MLLSPGVKAADVRPVERPRSYVVFVRVVEDEVSSERSGCVVLVVLGRRSRFARRRCGGSCGLDANGETVVWVGSSGSNAMCSRCLWHSFLPMAVCSKLDAALVGT